MEWGTALGLVAAGIVAGTVGSGGGVSSLVSYPALLAAGVPPLPANVANLVAGVTVAPGSALSSRRELAGSGTGLLKLLAPTVLGTVAGAALLVATPSRAFAFVVPFLVLSGSIVLAFQPLLHRWAQRSDRDRPALRTLVIAGVAVYGGYFGAGSGVMLLAALLILVEADLPRANAVKNVLLGVVSVVASVVFMLRGPVRWEVVVPLALGLFVGSMIGPIAVRWLPPGLVRWLAATCGFVLAGYLWIAAG